MADNPGRPLYAFFDLAVSPPGYDFISFLIAAELARIESASDSMRVVILPAPGTGFRDSEQDHNFDTDQKRWRIGNILLPACDLLPSISSTHVCADREEAEFLFAEVERRQFAVFPAQYSVAKPTQGWETKRPVFAAQLDKELPSLRAPVQAVSYVNDWLKSRGDNRKVISITLREAGWQNDRNSDLGEWVRFAHWLRQEGFAPVFLRDTAKLFDRADDEVSQFESFEPGPINIPLRTAFYEACYLNLFVSNGPAELAMFNGAVRYILYKASAPSEYKKFEHPHGATGLYTGQPLPFGTPYQAWDWRTDTFDVIKSEFLRMVEAIEASSGQAFERQSLKQPISAEMQLAAAHLYRTFQQLDEARTLYGLFQDQLGHTVEYRLWLAEIDLLGGDPASAKQATNDAFKISAPTTADYGSAGDIVLRCGDPDLAEQYYRNALELEGPSFETCVRLGMATLIRRAYDDATGWFEKALIAAPNHPFVLDKLAQIAKESGNPAKAIDLWMQARPDARN